MFKYLILLSFLPLLFSACHSKSTASTNETVDSQLIRQNQLATENANLKAQLIDKEIEEYESEKKRKLLSAATYLKKKNVRNRWDELITCRPHYRADKSLGGIYDPSVSVYNNTDYKIDNIEIELAYVKENGDIHKFERVYAINLMPHDSQQIDFPESGRGVSVDATFSSISSTMLNFCYQFPTRPSEIDQDDPFFCK